MMKNNINDYIQSVETIRKENKDRLHQSANVWNKYSNEKNSEISRQLFTIASFIFPLSLFPITNSHFINTLDKISKLILASSWICFILSITFGVISLAISSKFFKNWAEQENARSEAFSEAILTKSPIEAYNRFERMVKKSNELSKLSSSSNPIWLYIQEIFMILGATCLAIVLILLLKI